MNNNLILDLTVRLTQALDQNYDVVNMDTVLAVISALEGATITKEQLETTRLAKHINQLRRRNKSNILAIRAKNLLKKWREMVGITSQIQSDVASTTQQVLHSQQQAPKPPLSSTSQPASPYTQLLGENLDNSLSSIGGGIEFSRTATSGVSSTGSANFTFSKKLSASSAGEGGTIINSRSNGALTDTQTRIVKSSNRCSRSNNSPSLSIAATKLKHPTSFKNLIVGFNANNVPKSKSNASGVSPKMKLPPGDGSGGGGGGGNGGSNSNGDRGEPNPKTEAYIIDDDENQSQPSTTTTTGVIQIGVSPPRTHKSTKRRDSPEVIVFMERSSSPLGFGHLAQDSARNSQANRNNNVNQIVTSIIDLHDSNSNSNFIHALCEASEINTGNSEPLGVVTNSGSSKKMRKEKKRSNELFQPTIDESSRIAFPVTGIPEYLSLSNSSMSIFPSQQTAGSGEVERYSANAGSNDENQLPSLSNEKNSEVIDGDLTFAGKFKQSNSSGGIEVGSGLNYFSNGKENSSATSSEFPCGNMKVAINNCRDSVSAGGTASTSTFLPFSHNSNDSTSNSRTSQLDLIDVVNQDSQSMIMADDLRQQKQSSNDKCKVQRDVESARDTAQQVKYIKETSNKSKQYSKEQTKPVPSQGSINASSKPATPTLNFPQSSAITTTTVSPSVAEQKVPKKRGRKKGSKGVDSVLAQSAGLSSQFLMSPALGSSKKVKTTMELLADIQSRKLGSATSSPTLMNWLGTSRPASSCSEPSLHSPRTSDACSTNATVSTAARSTPEKNISNNSVADELYESDSDTNTSEPSHDSVKVLLTSTSMQDSQLKTLTGDGGDAAVATSTIEEQIRELMAQLPPVDPEKIDWDVSEDIPCTCTLREVPPEVVVDVEQTVKLEEQISLDPRNDDDRQDEDEPIISVNVLPPAQQHTKLSQSKLWPTAIAHSQSAPVSAVTSPVVPSANQKPMKSIFDLDFDEDNDPLHSFVEAATKTKKAMETTMANGRIATTEDEKLPKPAATTTTTHGNDHSDIVKAAPQEQKTVMDFEVEQPAPPVQQQKQQQQPAPPQTIGLDPIVAPPVNFPTYDVVEDPECKAKQRYEIQTNQITKFHIETFHNCFIPNVNGNWDHSTPQNIEDDCHYMENDSLYANVVPKYGCLVRERIPKDLSHVKFTKNFKPKSTDKSEKPPQPFLGVANIHRRQIFCLHHHRRSKKKALRKRKKHHSKSSARPKGEASKKIKKEKIKIKKEKKIKKKSCTSPQPQPQSQVTTTTVSFDIPDQTITLPKITATENDSKDKEIYLEEEREAALPCTPELSTISLLNYNDDICQEKCTTTVYNNVDAIPTPEEEDLHASADENSEVGKDSKQELVENTVKPILNGNIHHLVNNNCIVHCSDETKSDISGSTKIMRNNNHNNSIIENNPEENAAAVSRRSSSCSNSSLKQNQKSINQKLRIHLLERRRQSRRQRRKRKYLPSYTDVFDFDGDEIVEQATDPPLIKRMKSVNDEFPKSRRLTNSITDSSCLEDDGDLDCYHLHSENDLITEEELDDDCDKDAEYEDIMDDYDEEDGDDEEEAEENYGDFHEVVTRDMTSSTTGNNHIVLTIKKTPSKTNSPSSSSMSPAPVINKLSSNVQSTVDALLSGDNTIDLTPAESDYREKGKIEIEKLLELSTVKTVDLIDKTDFFLPEPTSLNVYSFQMKKNGDNDHGDEEEGNEANEEANENENENESEQTENAKQEENEKSEKKETTAIVTPEINPKDFKEITKSELSESIQLTQRHLRRLELKTHLRRGIEEAQKLHQQLFFPYELHTSIGSKILEISSATSDCTDPSDDETEYETTSGESNSSSSSSSSSDSEYETGAPLKRRKRTKLPPRKRRSAPGGGGDPSSSSSSSSESSSSSSGSSFASWATTSSSDEDEKKKKKPPPPPPTPVAVKEEKDEASKPKPNEDEKELPAENNYLLRSFNHIYVSTEERRRQQQQQNAQTRREQILNINNSGYITLTGDEEEQPTAPCTNFDIYTNYYNNPSLNIYSTTSNNTSNIVSINNILMRNTNVESSVVRPSSSVQATVETEVDVESTEEEEAPIKVETAASETATVEQNTLTASTTQAPTTKESTNADSNNRINPDSSIGSDNINKNNDENASEENMVAQEEYRTGLRKVDEDVDDEDGNNCARTQQFKEWHEVLQLRSYNDELLTVLPYVVIE